MRFVRFTGEILENFKGGARQRLKARRRDVADGEAVLAHSA